MIAHFHRDPDWAQVRPPMVRLPEEKWPALLADLDALGFQVAPR
jgi:hypothetical protein